MTDRFMLGTVKQQVALYVCMPLEYHAAMGHTPESWKLAPAKVTVSLPRVDMVVAPEMAVITGCAGILATTATFTAATDHAPKASVRFRHSWYAARTML